MPSTPVKVKVLMVSVIQSLVRQPGDIVWLPAGIDLSPNVELCDQSLPLTPPEIGPQG